MQNGADYSTIIRRGINKSTAPCMSSHYLLWIQLILDIHATQKACRRLMTQCLQSGNSMECQNVLVAQSCKVERMGLDPGHKLMTPKDVDQGMVCKRALINVLRMR